MSTSKGELTMSGEAHHPHGDHPIQPQTSNSLVPRPDSVIPDLSRLHSTPKQQERVLTALILRVCWMC